MYRDVLGNSQNEALLTSELFTLSELVEYKGREFRTIRQASEDKVIEVFMKMPQAREVNPRHFVQWLSLNAGIVPMRYLINVFDYGIYHQLSSFKMKAVVVGVGRIGSSVAEHLARLGYGEIHLIDSATILEENIPTQSIATPESVGLPNVEVMKKRIEEVNNSIRVVAVNDLVNRGNIDMLIPLESSNVLVLSATNNHDTQELLKIHCSASDKFFLYKQTIEDMMLPHEVNRQSFLFMENFSHKMTDDENSFSQK